MCAWISQPAVKLLQQHLSSAPRVGHEVINFANSGGRGPRHKCHQGRPTKVHRVEAAAGWLGGPPAGLKKQRRHQSPEKIDCFSLGAKNASDVPGFILYMIDMSTNWVSNCKCMKLQLTAQMEMYKVQIGSCAKHASVWQVIWNGLVQSKFRSPRLNFMPLASNCKSQTESWKCSSKHYKLRARIFRQKAFSRSFIQKLFVVPSSVAKRSAKGPAAALNVVTQMSSFMNLVGDGLHGHHVIHQLSIFIFSSQTSNASIEKIIGLPASLTPYVHRSLFDGLKHLHHHQVCHGECTSRIHHQKLLRDCSADTLHIYHVRTLVHLMTHTSSGLTTGSSALLFLFTSFTTVLSTSIFQDLQDLSSS